MIRTKEKYLLSNKRWKEKNPDKVKVYKRRYYFKHREECVLYNKEYYQKNKAYSKKWYDKNKEKLRVYDRVLKKKRYKRDIRFRLNSIIRAHIFTALKGRKAGRKWEILVGYALKDLMNRLENQFDNKMDWDNYGSYWVIDHKKPRSLFHYVSSEDPEFKKCWALENLQPMEKIENIIKSNKY